MSRVRLQLDEDCQAHALAAALRQHGIDAKTPNEVALEGVEDQAQLGAALAAGRVVDANGKLISSLSAEQMRNRLEWLNSWGANRP